MIYLLKIVAAGIGGYVVGASIARFRNATDANEAGQITDEQVTLVRAYYRFTGTAGLVIVIWANVV